MSVKQIDVCKPWLVQLINDAEITIAVTMGATALRALNRIERHGLALKEAAGRIPGMAGDQALAALGRQR